MSQAEELLNSSMETYTANVDDEPHIVIGEDRFITVPDELKRIAVQFDHRAETVTFDCPRYWDNQDMSQMKIYINYERQDGLVGMYLAQNVKADELDPNIMHFDWTITRNVAGINGPIEFNVCCKKVDRDGNEQIHWNSELNTEMYVSEGMENFETVQDENPDIISQLLERMDECEEAVTDEAVQGKFEHWLVNNTTVIQDQVEQDVAEYLSQHEDAIPEAMQEYVVDYITDHPPVLAIGGNKPTMECLWFDTGVSTGEENTVLKMISDDPKEMMQVAVEETTITDYNFDIN